MQSDRALQASILFIGKVEISVRRDIHRRLIELCISIREDLRHGIIHPERSTHGPCPRRRMTRRLSVPREMNLPSILRTIMSPSSVLHRSLHNEPLEVVSTKGQYLTLSSGHKVFDACGGAAVSCIGHSDPRVVSAIAKQLETVDYIHSRLYTCGTIDYTHPSRAIDTGSYVICELRI